MSGKRALSVVIVGLIFLCAAIDPADSQTQQPPTVAIPQPGVPQIMTMEGRFVRVAYNNEGYVILGYQLANRSLGEEWMLIEVGMTIRDKVPNYDLTREALSSRRQTARHFPCRRSASTGRRARSFRRCRIDREPRATRSTTFRRARAGRAH